MTDQPKRLFEKQIDDAVRAEVEDILREARKISLNSPNGSVEICNMIAARLK